MTNGAAPASIGQLAGLVVAAAGAVYLGVLTTMMVKGVPFPPPEPYSTVFHVLLLASVLAMVPLWCAIHLASPPRHRVYSLASLVFLAILVALVAVNRFVALTLVRQSPGLGRADGLEWFLPYGWPSFTFALECLGFGIFFSLACLLLVPVFRTGRLERWIAGTFAVIGTLSTAAVVGLALDSTALMGLVAPVAWGVGPILAAALVVRWLRSHQPAPASL